jgi:hypothetical protein
MSGKLRPCPAAGTRSATVSISPVRTVVAAAVPLDNDRFLVSAVDLRGAECWPMTQYTPDTIEDLCKVLRGLSHRMKVEIEPGIPLAAKTLADLRARTSWPPGLRLIVPDEPDRLESVVKVERRE